MKTDRWFNRIFTGIVFFGFTVLTDGSAQDSLQRFDPDFIGHLVLSGEYRDALYLISRSECKTSAEQDQMSYFKGWSHYSLKELEPSAVSLLEVGKDSRYYLTSRFFAAYDYTHLGKYDKAIEVLNGIEIPSDKFRSMKDFELSGIYLLKGDNRMFRETFEKTGSNYFEISDARDKLKDISAELCSHNKKSPVLAGIFSGIIPGSGKFYAGKKGEAVSSFIATTGLGLVAYENIHRRGLMTFPAILFSTAFAFTYVSNIYGAIVTANIIETEYRENVKNTILISLHIPLRNTFNR